MRNDNLEYIEQDTICDTCDYFSSCSENKVDITSSKDVRRHYFPAFGVICKRIEEINGKEL